MRIVLLMEGDTERELPPFLKRWLDRQNLPEPVGIYPVKFQGNQHYLKDFASKTDFHLHNLFPTITLPKECQRPEEVNFEEPPSKLLDRLFSQGKEGRGYKKTVMARNLLPKLEPDLVCQKCPNFKLMMDEMLALARQTMAS